MTGSREPDVHSPRAQGGSYRLHNKAGRLGVPRGPRTARPQSKGLLRRRCCFGNRSSCDRGGLFCSGRDRRISTRERRSQTSSFRTPAASSKSYGRKCRNMPPPRANRNLRSQNCMHSSARSSRNGPTDCSRPFRLQTSGPINALPSYRRSSMKNGDQLLSVNEELERARSAAAAAKDDQARELRCELEEAMQSELPGSEPEPRTESQRARKCSRGQDPGNLEVRGSGNGRIQDVTQTLASQRRRGPNGLLVNGAQAEIVLERLDTLATSMVSNLRSISKLGDWAQFAGKDTCEAEQHAVQFRFACR